MSEKLPGLDEIPDIENDGLPNSFEQYAETLEKLIIYHEPGVTIFNGGPLDLGGGQEVWVSPAEVNDGVSFSYFQLLFINTHPAGALNNSKIDSAVLDIDEASLKLAPIEHLVYQQLVTNFLTGKKHVLFRHCNSGLAYFPRCVIPNVDSQIVEDHLYKIISAAGTSEPAVTISLKKPSTSEDIEIVPHQLEPTHMRKYTYEGSEIYSYGVILEDDLWKYYEIFTPRPLEQMHSKNMYLRLDSGCDIGQIYDDRGCDCREQLHQSLKDLRILGNGGVIHIPSQDGRGFGMATKMETEGLKRGIEVATNIGDTRQYNTIEAAQRLLGPNFDIRTFDGAGRVLAMLGVDSVILQTDNKLKTEGLEAAGIQVKRQPTNTQGLNGSSLHVRAKHNHSQIYYGKEDK